MLSTRFDIESILGLDVFLELSLCSDVFAFQLLLWLILMSDVGTFFIEDNRRDIFGSIWVARDQRLFSEGGNLVVSVTCEVGVGFDNGSSCSLDFDASLRVALAHCLFELISCDGLVFAEGRKAEKGFDLCFVGVFDELHILVLGFGSLNFVATVCAICFVQYFLKWNLLE